MDGMKKRDGMEIKERKERSETDTTRGEFRDGVTVACEEREKKKDHCIHVTWSE